MKILKAEWHSWFDLNVGGTSEDKLSSQKFDDYTQYKRGVIDFYSEHKDQIKKIIDGEEEGHPKDFIADYFDKFGGLLGIRKVGDKYSCSNPKLKKLLGCDGNGHFDIRGGVNGLTPKIMEFAKDIACQMMLFGEWNTDPEKKAAKEKSLAVKKSILKTRSRLIDESLKLDREELEDLNKVKPKELGSDEQRRFDSWVRMFKGEGGITEISQSLHGKLDGLLKAIKNNVQKGGDFEWEIAKLFGKQKCEGLKYFIQESVQQGELPKISDLIFCDDALEYLMGVIEPVKFVHSKDAMVLILKNFEQDAAMVPDVLKLQEAISANIAKNAFHLYACDLPGVVAYEKKYQLKSSDSFYATLSAREKDLKYELGKLTEEKKERSPEEKRLSQKDMKKAEVLESMREVKEKVAAEYNGDEKKLSDQRDRVESRAVGDSFRTDKELGGIKDIRDIKEKHRAEEALDRWKAEVERKHSEYVEKLAEQRREWSGLLAEMRGQAECDKVEILGEVRSKLDSYREDVDGRLKKFGDELSTENTKLVSLIRQGSEDIIALRKEYDAQLQEIRDKAESNKQLALEGGEKKIAELRKEYDEQLEQIRVKAESDKRQVLEMGDKKLSDHKESYKKFLEELSRKSDIQTEELLSLRSKGEQDIAELKRDYDDQLSRVKLQAEHDKKIALEVGESQIAKLKAEYDVRLSQIEEQARKDQQSALQMKEGIERSIAQQKEKYDVELKEIERKYDAGKIELLTKIEEGKNALSAQTEKFDLQLKNLNERIDTEKEKVATDKVQTEKRLAELSDELGVLRTDSKADNEKAMLAIEVAVKELSSYKGFCDDKLRAIDERARIDREEVQKGREKLEKEFSDHQGKLDEKLKKMDEKSESDKAQISAEMNAGIDRLSKQQKVLDENLVKMRDRANKDRSEILAIQQDKLEQQKALHDNKLREFEESSRREQEEIRKVMSERTGQLSQQQSRYERQLQELDIRQGEIGRTVVNIDGRMIDLGREVKEGREDLREEFRGALEVEGLRQRGVTEQLVQGVRSDIGKIGDRVGRLESDAKLVRASIVELKILSDKYSQEFEEVHRKCGVLGEKAQHFAQEVRDTLASHNQDFSQKLEKLQTDVQKQRLQFRSMLDEMEDSMQRKMVESGDEMASFKSTVMSGILEERKAFREQREQDIAYWLGLEGRLENARNDLDGLKSQEFNLEKQVHGMEEVKYCQVEMFQHLQELYNREQRHYHEMMSRFSEDKTGFVAEQKRRPSMRTEIRGVDSGLDRGTTAIAKSLANEREIVKNEEEFLEKVQKRLPDVSQEISEVTAVLLNDGKLYSKEQQLGKLREVHGKISELKQQYKENINPAQKKMLNNLQGNIRGAIEMGQGDKSNDQSFAQNIALVVFTLGLGLIYVLYAAYSEEKKMSLLADFDDGGLEALDLMDSGLPQSSPHTPRSGDSVSTEVAM